MPMNSTPVKLAVAGILVVLLFVGGWYATRRGGVNRPVRLPNKSITTIPMEIGSWKGKETPMEDKLFQGVNAHEVVSRAYTNSVTKRDLTLHCAVFDEFWRIVPHTPERCYQMNGWATMSTEDFPLNTSDGGSVIARLASFEKDGNHIFVLFWFQFEDAVMCDDAGLRRVREDYPDSDTWPSIVKVMIQTSAEESEAARKQLKEYADALYEVTRTIK